MQRFAPFEQTVLRRSIWVTVVTGVFSIVFGLFVGSSSIVFDGVFSSLDAVMTIIALLVTKLVAHENSARFQHGFWHLEPIILFVNGGTLIVLCFYAFIGSIFTVLRGGNVLAFDWAVLYVFVLSCICFGMVFYEHRINRRLRSDFIALDVQNWLATAMISLALLIAFVAAFLLDGTPYAWITPYVDPMVLMILAVGLVFIPLKTVRKAVQEILLMTPERMDLRVRDIMDRMQEKYGFSNYSSYVMKVGRARFIELHIVLPHDYAIPSIATLDTIREDIGAEIGGAGPHRWITVSFTGDEAWI